MTNSDLHITVLAAVGSTLTLALISVWPMSASGPFGEPLLMPNGLVGVNFVRIHLLPIYGTPSLGLCGAAGPPAFRIWWLMESTSVMRMARFMPLLIGFPPLSP